MTGHPDPDVLAEFREGLLGWRRARRIRGHLAGCTRCAAVDREITEVSSLLASAPAPTMPDTLARRLEAALTAESAARAAQAHGQETAQAAGSAAPAAARVQDGEPITEPGLPGQDGRDHQHQPVGRPGEADRPGLTGRAGEEGRVSPPGQADQQGEGAAGARRARRPDLVARPRRPAGRRVPALRAAAIAAAVVVIAGGGYGLTRVLNGPAGPSSGSSGGIPRPAHNAQGAPGAIRGTGPEMGRPAGSAGSAGTLPLIRSGTDYQPGQLVAQVEHELRRLPVKEAPLSGESAPQPQDQGLTGCVLAITRGVRPQLVDAARYRGRPATIIVTAATAGQPGQVWVAGSNCSAGRPDVIAHTRLSGTG